MSKGSSLTLIMTWNNINHVCHDGLVMGEFMLCIANTNNCNNLQLTVEGLQTKPFLLDESNPFDIVLAALHHVMERLK